MNYTQFMFLKILCQYLCVYYCHTFANIEFISHYLIPSLFENKCLWDAIGPFRAYDTYWPKSTSLFQIQIWLNINTSYMQTYQYLQTISLIFPYFGFVSWSIQKIDILFYQIHVFFLTAFWFRNHLIQSLHQTTTARYKWTWNSQKKLANI